MVAVETGVRGWKCSADCGRCPQAKNGAPVKSVPGFGGTGGLCVVGEGPGQNELLQGYPFIGESGRVLNRAFKNAGIDRGYVFITNATLCRRPGTDEDLDTAVDACRMRLEADLDLAHPTAICALGGTAMRALQLPVTFVAQARGTVQYSPLAPGIPVVGTIHPAALLRGGAGELTAGGKQKMNVDAQAMFFFSDVEKAHKIAMGEVAPTWSDDILVVHEAANVAPAMEAILADIYEWGMLGLDLEWTCEGSKNPLDALGAGAHRAQITWVGIGCAKRSVSFKWEALLEDYNERGMELPNGAGVSESGLAMLQAAMEMENLPKLAHNKQADKAVWEAQVGSINGRILDTMLLHHAACPGIDHDLQQVVSQFLCVPPWKVEHARAVAARKQEEREAAKAEKTAEKERKKAERIATHEEKNRKSAEEKAARKAAKQAAHEARNAALHAEKEARKAAKKGKKSGAPDVLPGQLSFEDRAAARTVAASTLGGPTHLMLSGYEGGDMANQVLGDILDPPEPFEFEREDGDPFDEE